MHPKTLEILEAMNRAGQDEKQPPFNVLTGPHHFHISRGINDAAFAIACDEMQHSLDQGEQFSTPINSNLPCESMVMTVHRENDDVEVYLLKAENDYIVICLAVWYPGFPYACSVMIGAYVPGQGIHKVPEAIQKTEFARQFMAAIDDDTLLGSISRIAFIVSLINEPTRVAKTEATAQEINRAHRKRVERITGKAAQAWTNVRWTVGERSAAKRSKGDEEWKGRALHWCRAHWRSCNPGDVGAQWVDRKSGGKSGWHKWIKDCWRGHPDFGIKLQRHKPAMPGEKRPGAQYPTAIVDQTRFKAMGAQQRASLAAAGFAPSAALN